MVTSSNIALKSSNTANAFQAFYPEHLKDKDSNVSKIALFILIFPIGLYKIMQYAMHRLTGLFILQGQFTSCSDRKKRKKNNDLYIRDIKRKFEKKGFQKVEELFLKTPDNIKLNALAFKSKDPKGTIIFFGGTAFWMESLAYYNDPECYLNRIYYHKLDEDILKYSIRNKLNVILFNPRGVGLSEGWASKKGLYLDSETVYQYAQNQLNTKEEDIILWGHSLGGALATELASKHPKANLINDRSFSTLSNAIRYIGGIPPKTLLKIAVYIAKFFGWEYDITSLWNSCLNNKKIVYSSKDYCIPYEASLFKAVSTIIPIIPLRSNSCHMSGLNESEFRNIISRPCK